jgi:hypothetical protein
MRLPNTDRKPNKPVTLPRNQLLLRCAVTSPVHTVTIRGNVTRVYPPLTGTLREAQFTFLIVSRSFLLTTRNVSDNRRRQIQNTHFVVSKSRPPENRKVYLTMWGNMVEPDRLQTTV